MTKDEFGYSGSPSESNMNNSNQLDLTVEVIENFRSKEDMYSFLTETRGYFLPTYKSSNLRFLKQILTGEKCILKKTDI